MGFLSFSLHLQRDTLMKQYSGCIENPWDEIAVRYVMVTSHVARKRPGEAFNEQSQLISCVYANFGLVED
jgi:COP9 signalosome complex subunit 12